MAQVKALVVTGNGTNCEKESAHAALESGAEAADIVFFSDLEADRTRLADYNFLIFPGGFLDGDDLGAAQAAALRWKHATAGSRSLMGDLKSFFDKGGLILGICNGFQLLVKLGLLPALSGDYFTRQVTLSQNDSARFEDRWVHLLVNPDSPCVFTRNLDSMYLPVRHGEGKIVAKEEAIIEELQIKNLIALQYADSSRSQWTADYPDNPNGSPLGIAGLTDPSGRILGLMPHPEAYNHPTNHPGWTRGESDPLGLTLFENAVRYIHKS